MNQSSSSLSLPLTVLKKDFKSSYTCVAKNPAGQKTSLVNMTACGAETEQKTQRKAKDIVILILTFNFKNIILVVYSLLFLLTFYF